MCKEKLTLPKPKSYQLIMPDIEWWATSICYTKGNKYYYFFMVYIVMMNNYYRTNRVPNADTRIDAVLVTLR